VEDDFDHEIIDWLADEFEEDIDLRLDPMSLQRLEAAEKAKNECLLLKLK
jgi:molecular chaperone DnaK